MKARLDNPGGLLKPGTFAGRRTCRTARNTKDGAMKLVIVSVHFEYADVIERIIDRHDVAHYFVYPRIEGRDSEGFHEGSQVHPGNLSAIHARIDDEAVDALLDDLQAFRVEKKAHHHLAATVLPVERWMGPESG